MSDEIESAKSQRTNAMNKFTRNSKEFLRALDAAKGLQRSFGDAMEKEVSYVQSKAVAGKKAMDEKRLQVTTKKDQEKWKR